MICKLQIKHIEHEIKGCNSNIGLVLQNSARLTVPGGASVACSTAKAVEWDAAWSNNLDPSGRAALGVHISAYDNQNQNQNQNQNNLVNKASEFEKIIPMEASSVGVAIQS
jgi:asparagine synthase (glutamine-hydrolysing)